MVEYPGAMSTWSHFLVGSAIVPADEENDSRSNCYQSVTSKSSHSVLPEGFDPSIDPTIIHTLSSSPLQGMSRNPSEQTIECLPGKESLDESFRATETNAIPRRNLTEAFEELYVEPADTIETPLVKQTTNKETNTNMISPTGVDEIDAELARVPTSEPIPMKANLVTPDKSEPLLALPRFDLHNDLKRELSDALVDRVSFYAVIHDINKEATAMASNDDAGYQRNPEDLHEQYDPLVVAVNGQPKEKFPASNDTFKFAIVDEERWLLDAIDSRNSDETRAVNACPPTFLQAMGEREYENPLASLSNGSRTQLWKPSRSWWEAKSGKNPWIEPKSHNKRWRYLWPLIHYHKFLARCIKKLKRNGVDVKTSVSPVSVFLREEVCAVSDHLASVSLFGSDEWMACLEHFNGWTNSDPESEATIRKMVAQLRLRPLTEPGDIDSPLLRSQIDEQYLRAMATARAQMTGVGTEERRFNKMQNKGSGEQTPDAKGSKKNSAGHPPAYPRGGSPRAPGQQHANGNMPANMRGHRWNYASQGPHWWGGWHQHPHYHYGDDTSVQSGLSGESYPQPIDMGMYAGHMHHPYYPPMMYPPQHQPAQGQPVPFDGSVQDPRMYGMDGYSAEHYPGSWVLQNQEIKEEEEKPESPKPPKTPSSSGKEKMAETPHTFDRNEMHASEQTPYKYNPSSPYWGHLDHTTLAMMGIATPQGISTPQTPHRGGQSPSEGGIPYSHPEDANAAVMNAQPLLLRQQYHSYGYYGNREAYAPPSPATQFMMSPQANFAYAYGAYGPYSPSQTSPSQQFSPSVKKRLDTSEHSTAAQPSSSTPKKEQATSSSSDGQSDA